MGARTEDAREHFLPPDHTAVIRQGGSLPTQRSCDIHGSPEWPSKTWVAPKLAAKAGDREKISSHRKHRSADGEQRSRPVAGAWSKLPVVRTGERNLQRQKPPHNTCRFEEYCLLHQALDPSAQPQPPKLSRGYRHEEW
uniref:SFRICE_038124 n=1 Tax=Spodoptera frugiperda TaxID=7108 RepID=A0A2H1WME7_SPOFR